MGMIREHKSFTFVPETTLASVVACAILERSSGFEHLSEALLQGFEAFNRSKILAFDLDLPVAAISLFVISLVFSALISILYLVQVLLGL